MFVMRSTKTTASDSEAVYLQALKNNESHAYERLVRDNRSRLIAAAFRIVGNHEDALDVVQEAFLSAYRSMHRFRGGARVSTWLYRITVNAALMHVRKQKTRQERSMDQEAQSSLMEKEDAAVGNPEQLLVAKQAFHRIDERLRKLPTDHRSVFVMREFQERDTKQTARSLGISTNAVKIRLHRARRALLEDRALLERSA